ncbi:hypothetical protein [Lactobacillus sp. B4005]|uniref:hypothetical protein n=1 Tax=Lactobacillus sp. B4005 TaxID=2818031 RepID=UPI0022699604|nr:hypothetical protein [Lactobacillus sp. B4005]MCX8722374.1 hypothetical protein [Lactobacillus sp. B4005]
MAKLSKQDKIEIYHLWHDYQVGPKFAANIKCPNFRVHFKNSFVCFLLFSSHQS